MGNKSQCSWSVRSQTYNCDWCKVLNQTAQCFRRYDWPWVWAHCVLPMACCKHTELLRLCQQNRPEQNYFCLLKSKNSLILCVSNVTHTKCCRPPALHVFDVSPFPTHLFQMKRLLFLISGRVIDSICATWKTYLCKAPITTVLS